MSSDDKTYKNWVYMLVITFNDRGQKVEILIMTVRSLSSQTLSFMDMFNLDEDLIIDCETREIMHLEASDHPSACLFVCLHVISGRVRIIEQKWTIGL